MRRSNRTPPPELSSTKKETIKPPRLVRWQGSTTEPIGIEEEASFENLLLEGHDYSDLSAQHVVFQSCHFKGVNLGRTDFPDFDLGDVRFDDCDIANGSWHKGILERVQFAGCRLLGFMANEARIANVTFEECNASLAQFRFATLRAVCFDGCNLQGADFQESDLRGVIFRNCNLRDARMSGARLEGADLRGSEIEGLRLGTEFLAGTVVEPSQAAYLASLLGLRVVSMEEEV